MLCWARALLALLLAGLAASAGANAIVTLDFNTVQVGSGGNGGEVTLRDAYFEDGFRVATSLRQVGPDVFLQDHYDFVCGGSGPVHAGCGVTGPAFNPAYDGTTWLGTDWASCQVLDGGTVVGSTQCEPHIRIDHFGSAFSALDALSVLTGWTLTSSKGGVIAALTGATALMAGDLWTDILWLELSTTGLVGAPVGIDNLRLSVVPEPSMVALLFAALAAMAWVRSRSPRRSALRVRA